MTYDPNGFTDCQPANNKFLEDLKMDLKKSDQYSFYKLEECHSEGNAFDWKQSKRIYSKEMIYRLIHDDGTETTFHAPEDDDEFCHVIMFFIVPEHQGNYFFVRKRFREVWELLCVRRKMIAMYSPCLTAPMPDHPSRIPDRRFEKISLENYPECTRILMMYLRLGGHLPQLPDDNPMTLYFHSPEHVMSAKESVMSLGMPNPYKNAHRSIYDRKTEVLLHAFK